MGISPTKTGEMREDQFWLLKSNVSHAFWEAEDECIIEPIIDERVDAVSDPQMLYGVVVKSY